MKERREKKEKFVDYKKSFWAMAIFCIFWMFVAIIACCALDLEYRKNDTNNIIIASADSDNVETWLPFDMVATGTQSAYCFNSFDNDNSVFVNNVQSYNLGGLKFEIKYINGYYFLFYNYTNIDNNLFFIKYNMEDYGSRVFGDEITYYPLSLIRTSYNTSAFTGYYIPLSSTAVGLDFVEFSIVYYQSGIVRPIIFIQDIIKGEQKLVQDVYYDTTSSYTARYGSAQTSTNVVNLIDYDYFKVKTVSPDTSWVCSINGFTNNNPTKSVRNFTFVNVDTYVEGYNAGYDEGYQNGVSDTLDSMAFNPFNDDWKMGASVMAYQHGGDIITPSNPASPYYQYTNYGIRETFSLKSAYSQIYTDYMAYITFSRYIFNLNDYTNDGIKITEGLQLKYGYYITPENVDGTFTNLAGENITIELTLKRLSDQNATLITLDYVSTDSPIIDFSNINGVDYTDYYLRIVQVYKYGSSSFNATYYKSLEFNQYLGSYAQGYQNGYNSGISQSNYQKGYNAGYNDGRQVGGNSFLSLFAALVDTPIHYLNTLFNYEILGTNIKNFLLALLTIAIVIAAIRFATGKKE